MPPYIVGVMNYISNSYFTYTQCNEDTYREFKKTGENTKFPIKERKIWMKRAIVMRLLLDKAITKAEYKKRMDILNTEWSFLTTRKPLRKIKEDSKSKADKHADTVNRLREKLKQKKQDSVDFDKFLDKLVKMSVENNKTFTLIDENTNKTITINGKNGITTENID